MQPDAAMPAGATAGPASEASSASGVGLRAPHHRDILQGGVRCGWLEVHSENFFAAGGARIRCLAQIRERYPVSLHGVGLSLGSVDPLSREHLRNLKRAIDTFRPVRVSEHLCWSSVDGRFANDLLPLPHTQEALRHISRRIDSVQADLGRQILIENVSSYAAFRDSPMTEWDFLTGVAQEARCGILLDINNIYVAARNHGFDPHEYLEAIPAHLVQEFHLAGHTVAQVSGNEILIDTHSRPICEAVWELYASAVRKFGAVPTLIEWDADIPPLPVLLAEAAKADRIQRDVLHAVP